MAAGRWPRPHAARVDTGHPGDGVRGRRAAGRHQALELIEADAAGQFVRHLAEATTHLAEESGELLNAVTFLLFRAVLLGRRAIPHPRRPGRSVNAKRMG